jgi:hypothetical protein
VIRRHLRDLRPRLLWTLLPPLLLLAVLGSALDDYTVRRVTGDAHDRTLASTAIGLAARNRGAAAVTLFALLTNVAMGAALVLVATLGVRHALRPLHAAAT